MKSKVNIAGLCKGVLFFFVLLVAMIACSKQGLKPPVAKKIAHIDTMHGDVVVDNYYWLRERNNPEVLDYLKAENAYTDSVMKHTEAFQEKLFKEMRKRIKEDDMSAPVKIDSFYYYSRTEKGKQYRIYCRKLKSLQAPEEVLLDVNKMALGHDFYSLGGHFISPNHRLLAYAIDTTGNEHYTLYIKNLKDSSLLPDVIENTDGNIVWANDNKTIFYTTLDDISHPDRLYRHVLGHLTKNDVMIYREKDKTFGVYVEKSLDDKYIFMALWANSSSEYRYLRADRPTGKFKLLKKRQPKVEYTVAHGDGLFYIRTNEHAENFKIMTAPEKNPSPKRWKEFIGPRDSVMIADFVVFKKYMAVFERENGLKRVRILGLPSGKDNYITFSEPIYTVSPTGNATFNTKYLRVRYESMITPSTVYDYDMDKNTFKLIKQQEVRGYDKDLYITERIYAKAPDGVMIPISLMYKKGVKKNGKNPLYLTGYGSYGSSTEPNFSSLRLSLVDRGFVYAKAHVRGGSEMGRWWYEQGKLLHKKNTFTDFIACAEHLIAEGYTSKDKLVIAGGSAGGMLIGAVVNMRPDLFYIAIADVPFVDVINTMMDPTIPLTVNEYTEWGNPHEKKYYDYMKSYSPYDNIKAQAYPNMLITAGLNDPRVQYWEPAKFTAKLRAMKTDKNRLLLKTNMEQGHLGASGRYDYIKDVAFEYAFILDLFHRVR